MESKVGHEGYIPINNASRLFIIACFTCFVGLYVEKMLCIATCQSLRVYVHALNDVSAVVDNVSVDLEQMMKQKSGAVDGLTSGIKYLFGKNKVGAVGLLE